ncbi:helix-turn-helix domain-containing protein [Metabacillus fastidiosus]|uniref:Helix-turn-helix domain-containing protein n=1 Tax=Metabacillus fastidiosus TaxID=1458 RepID=A0ABU6P6F4_9BACI|nr:helix-turn-helix domain-containing protein [Metabacillus fastidiosus]
MTTDQVALFLNRSKGSIYNYVKEELLTPVADHPKWKMRKTTLFRKSEVEQFREKLTKPGITTLEAAKELGIEYTALMPFIYNGTLQADRKIFQGKERHFIKKEELSSFKNSEVFKNFLERKKKNNRATQDGWRLFQSLVNPESNTMARIMELNENHSLVITEDDEQFPIEEIVQRGFVVQHPITDKPYITRKGYAKFKFFKPYSIHSDIFQVIDYLYQIITHKNIKVIVEHSFIYLDIKPVFLEEMNQDFFSILNNGLYEGKIEQQPSGVSIESDLEPLYLSVPSHMKQLIKEIAKKENKTIEEVSIDALKRGLQNQ